MEAEGQTSSIGSLQYQRAATVQHGVGARAQYFQPSVAQHLTNHEPPLRVMRTGSSLVARNEERRVSRGNTFARLDFKSHVPRSESRANDVVPQAGRR
jgi:hypothetical protein